MRLSVFVSLAIALRLAAVTQTSDWQAIAKKAAEDEQAGEHMQAAVGFRAAIHAVEGCGDDSQLVPLLRGLAAASVGLGSLTDAEGDYRRAMVLVEKYTGKQSADYVQLLCDLASLYLQEHRGQLAAAIAAEAERIGLRVLPEYDRRRADLFLMLGNLRSGEGKYDQADSMLRQVDRLCGRPELQCQDRLAAVYNGLGAVSMHSGMVEDALAWFTRSVETLEQTAGPNHGILVRPLINLGNAYAAASQFGNAEAAFKRSLTLAAANFGAAHPFSIEAASSYAAFLQRMGRRAEADVLAKKANAAWQDFVRTNGLGLVINRAEVQR